jgi:hypothetical protein
MSTSSSFDLPTALLDFASRPSQAANRMQAIQGVVKTEIERRFAPLGSLVDVRVERSVKGKHRTKNWDVVMYFAHRPQLAISTKSIMANAPGTVPNRIDDAMGEYVNVHAHDPGMVLGYVFVMNHELGKELTRDRRPWTDILADSLASFSGRRSGQDAPELFEGATLLVVDFQTKPPGVRFHPALLNWEHFFQVVVG